MVTSMFVGLFAVVFAVMGLSLTVVCATAAAVWAVASWATCRATPAAARGAYRTSHFVGRGACRTAAGAGRGCRVAAKTADSFWKRRGGQARQIRERTMDQHSVHVRTAAPKRPSLGGPLLSVAVLIAGAVFLYDRGTADQETTVAATPSLGHFAERTVLVYGKGAPYRFDSRVFDAVINADEAPFVGRTGFHTPEALTGSDPRIDIRGLSLSHTTEPYEGDDAVWSPLLWEGESFVAVTSGDAAADNDLYRVPDEALLESGRLKQVARASARFATPDEALDDLVNQIAYDKDLVTTPVPEQQREEVAVKALQRSAERLALVRWPLVVEGQDLGDVYRLHVALDPDQFREAWSDSVPRDAGGDPARLAMLAGLLAAGTLGLGVAARRQTA